MELGEEEIEKLKSLLLFFNPRDYYTDTPMSIILKTASDYRAFVCEIDGVKYVELTFVWNGDTSNGNNRIQAWKITFSEFIGAFKRRVCIEKNQERFAEQY